MATLDEINPRVYLESNEGLLGLVRRAIQDGEAVVAYLAANLLVHRYRSAEEREAELNERAVEYLESLRAHTAVMEKGDREQ